jgi:hypothetical protein
MRTLNELTIEVRINFDRRIITNTIRTAEKTFLSLQMDAKAK